MRCLGGRIHIGDENYSGGRAGDPPSIALAERLRELPLKQDRFGFEPEVTAKLARRKYRVTETPCSYHPRGYDEGKKIGFRDALNAIYCIVRYGLAD